MNLQRGIANAFTVDVEDYYHVAAFSKVINPDQWEQLEPHVVLNTNRIMKMLETNNVKATFFVLGWVAERNRDMVKNIDRAGHEVACHGYSHKLIYTQTRNEFTEETKKSKYLLEDIIGKKVKGYRAASYSITKKSLWALDVLAECGFEYDSSVFPVRHDNYGITNSPRFPYRILTSEGYVLNELPLSTIKILNYNLPVAGGGYFRLFPYFFTKYAFRKIRRTNPFVFYIHPWEIDIAQPRIKASLLSRFRHYNNIDVCEERLSRLLADFSFVRADELLSSFSLAEPISVHSF